MASPAALALMSVICIAPLNAQDPGTPILTVDEVHTSVEQWVLTRRVISDERRNWALGREVLEQRLDLVQAEIDALRSRIEEAQSSITGTNAKREELVVENDQLKASSGALAATVDQLEQRARKLLPRLPDPIRDRVKPLSQRFPEDAAETTLSLGERFQNVVGVLNEINKFNREISVTSEVRTLEDGNSAEVTALYVGIGQAYYVSGDRRFAGIGNTSESAWTWTAANSAAEQISQAIAVHSSEQEPAYVRLPIQIQ